MSNPLLGIMTEPEPDPKNLTLVQKIIEKTSQKRIYWQKSTTGFAASIGAPLPMHLEFSSQGQTWRTFRVQTKEGPILKVDNTILGSMLLHMGGASDPLVALTSQLYRMVSHLGEGQIERAIDAIERL